MEGTFLQVVDSLIEIFWSLHLVEFLLLRLPFFGLLPQILVFRTFMFS
jgi:hypothetical protein